MTENELPKTDSIKELASFWDEHDITDFEDSLEEVKGRLFNKGKEINIHLKQEEFESVEKLARQNGLEKDVLIRKWIIEKLNAA